MVISVIALVVAVASVFVAFFSVLVSLWQFSIRTRPFIGVSGCVSAGDHYDLVLKNWGDVAAKDLTIAVALWETNISRRKIDATLKDGKTTGSLQEMEVLLPQQTMTVDINPFILTGQFKTKLSVKITYCSPFNLRLGEASLGFHTFEQIGWTLPSGEWRAEALVRTGVFRYPSSKSSLPVDADTNPQVEPDEKRAEPPDASPCS